MTVMQRRITRRHPPHLTTDFVLCLVSLSHAGDPGSQLTCVHFFIFFIPYNNKLYIATQCKGFGKRRS